MVGPTGSGKTEIARRLAKIAKAPFIKVEATKYTELGFYGRDVDSIIKDLVQIAVNQSKVRLKEEYSKEADQRVEEKLLDLLSTSKNPEARKNFQELLQSGQLEDRIVEVLVPASPPEGFGNRIPFSSGGGGGGINDRIEEHFPSDMMSGLQNAFSFLKSTKKKLKVSEARPILKAEELEKMTSQEEVIKTALHSVENDGIVFIDEIDKICTKHKDHRADASAEGVQRDLLPIIEGTTVSTRYGNVRTDHILFICSGAFHNVKPADMLPELQGRLPVRVELNALKKDDFYKILTETENNLLKQQKALMSAEQIDLVFDDEAINEISGMSFDINSSIENIGARRLHTVVEKIIEDFSFNALDYKNKTIIITKEIVHNKIAPLLQKSDLNKFII